MTGFCRDCLADTVGRRCTACGSPRVVHHPAADRLGIAHVDCDAFYATIEKRDRPELADRPVIIGGGRRGVVAAACYVARTFGVRSAMPMFKALTLCPDAVVIRPDMVKYRDAGRSVRHAMQALTPLVEPLSIDEAFLDLSGTERLHGMSPARTLARFARAVEQDIGITVSVGLSANKFLAKIASDLDKPRGFTVIDPAEAAAFLASKPVGFIHGVGPAMQKRLAEKGFTLIADLQRVHERDVIRTFGAEGQRLWQLARGIDTRPVVPDRETKSISSETTFEIDIARFDELEKISWRLAEKVSDRLKLAKFAGHTVTLKLKTADHRTRTRAATLATPTQLAERIFAAIRELLGHEIDGTPFRLLGVGVSALTPATSADENDILDPHRAERARAVDDLRRRFGTDAIVRGLVFDPEPRKKPLKRQR